MTGAVRKIKRNRNISVFAGSENTQISSPGDCPPLPGLSCEALALDKG